MVGLNSSMLHRRIASYSVRGRSVRRIGAYMVLLYRVISGSLVVCSSSQKACKVKDGCGFGGFADLEYLEHAAFVCSSSQKHAR